MKFSIIIPVRNGGAAFAVCLSAVAQARAECRDLAATELIVVDDGSTDESVIQARETGALTLSTSGGRGPAAARNLGARLATSDYLFFVDADVALHPNALSLAAQAFQTDSKLEACFGSYDAEPFAPNFIAQYKNLLHHYVHQQAHPEAATFWTGCGAMRAATYRALGGLDEHTYARPSIEDIDLGYRLRRRGGHIRLIKAMQCKHLKRWTAASLLRSDIFERGIPWTVLLWREAFARRDREAQDGAALLDLNLQQASRVSVVMAGLLLMALIALPSVPQLWPLPVFCVGGLLWFNRALYHFFWHKRGVGFLLAAILWHWLYYLYNSLCFSLGTLQYFLWGTAPVNADGTLAHRAFNRNV